MEKNDLVKPIFDLNGYCFKRFQVPGFIWRRNILDLDGMMAARLLSGLWG